MTRLLPAILFALTGQGAASGRAPFKLVGSAEVARAMGSAKPPVVCDANNVRTRERAGVVPGATILSSSSKYDPARELPGDKGAPLVFYCANKLCTASHKAAETAIRAGYRDVSVMEDGIQGWRDAGRPVQSWLAASRVAPKAAQDLVAEEGAVIVDVREDAERSELVPGARWLPMSSVQDEKAWTEFVAGLPKGKTVVFHCSAGRRAKSAARKLSKEGFSTGFFDGTEEWKKAGLPLDKGPAR